jgi:hypothetical protein
MHLVYAKGREKLAEREAAIGKKIQNRAVLGPGQREG